MVIYLKIFRNYYVLCKCGCKKLTKILDKQGRVRIFINGHNSGLLKGENSSWWKGGRWKSNGYWKIYCPNHPKCDSHGYVLEHRLIMEKYIGRYLTEKEEVHHQNGKIIDNRIENLELLSKSEHRRITKLKNRNEIKCKICNNYSTTMRKTKLSGLRPIWYGNEKDGYTCSRCWCKLRNRTGTHTTLSTTTTS